MPLAQHLREFRKRLTLSAIGVLVGTIFGWLLYPSVFAALQAPVLEAAERSGSDVSINFAALAAALDMQIKMSVVIGIILSAPWWLYQLWAFVAPGLKRREQRYTIGFLAASIPLFFAGVTLAWFVFPNAVEVLTDFTPEGADNILDAQVFMTFAMRLILAFGIAFVFPVIIVALSAAGIVKSRTWLKGWRWAIMIIFTFTAVATPTPDAITMILMAIPMCFLYFGAIGVASLFDRARRRKSAAVTPVE